MRWTAAGSSRRLGRLRFSKIRSIEKTSQNDEAFGLRFRKIMSTKSIGESADDYWIGLRFGKIMSIKDLGESADDYWLGLKFSKIMKIKSPRSFFAAGV